MTTAVIGATGRIGAAVAGRLLKTGEKVHALVRDPGKAAPSSTVTHPTRRSSRSSWTTRPPSPGRSPGRTRPSWPWDPLAPRRTSSAP